MNLKETVEALEAKNVTVAIDLGVHEYCTLDSNCPLAIQLRRLIADAGVTLEQLLEGHEVVTNPPPLDYDLPAFDAHINLRIATKDIAVDLNDVISESVRALVKSKLEALNTAEATVRDAGVALYNTYLREIARQRDNHVLPQLEYSARELLNAKCFITSDSGHYYFLFSVDYNPEYLIKDGIRYKLSDRDIREIKRKAYVQVVITPENKITNVLLLNESGDKLQHYHGDTDNDCWGAVHIPQRWDRRLSSLSNFVRSLMGSLATINLGSLLVHEPLDMPDNEELMEHSTELGREGELEVEEVEPTEPTERPGWGRTAWGRGGQPPRNTGNTTIHLTDIDLGIRDVETADGTPRRRRAPTTIDLGIREQPQGEPQTLDGQMIRRYGIAQPTGRERLDFTCALCGRRLGDHSGTRGEDCPVELTQEEEMVRRFGEPDP